MTMQQLSISVIDPISPAIEKVKLILFKPFDLGKWFVIGFCAWLAYLGSGGGGGGPNFNFGRGFDQRDSQPFHQAKDFVFDNLHWIIPAVIAVAVLIIAIGVLITWLSSRGRFMFLHCVAQNKAEVKIPWTKFRKQANSLFLFRIVVGIISFIFFALFIGVMVFITIIAARTNAHIGAPAIVGLILLSIIILIPVAIAFALLLKFTNDFVVPIMFLRTISCTAAWREFLTLLAVNKARFALYILFQIVISMAIAAIIFAAAIMTCCCAACILTIPYIGTVLMLPLLVFKRAYSLHYFRQFGHDFDVFAAETTVGRLST